MEEYRIIEITDGCMGGDSGLYLTNAPDEVTEKAIKQYREDDDWERCFSDFLHKYTTKILVTSDEVSEYKEISKKFNIDKVFTIW